MPIRVAIAADAAEIARVHVATWQIAYRGQIPDAILDALNPHQRTARWHEILARPLGVVFVATEESNIIGFGDLIPSRDTDADPAAIGEIAALYVHPDHWRNGTGRQLCRRIIQEAGDRGFNALTLWVLETNASAMRFYQSMGFIPDDAVKAELLKGFELREIRLRLPL